MFSAVVVSLPCPLYVIAIMRFVYSWQPNKIEGPRFKGRRASGCGTQTANAFPSPMCQIPYNGQTNTSACPIVRGQTDKRTALKCDIWWQ